MQPVSSTKLEQEVADELTWNPAIQRIAGFQSGALLSFAGVFLAERSFRGSSQLCP